MWQMLPGHLQIAYKSTICCTQYWIVYCLQLLTNSLMMCERRQLCADVSSTDHDTQKQLEGCTAQKIASSFQAFAVACKEGSVIELGGIGDVPSPGAQASALKGCAVEEIAATKFAFAVACKGRSVIAFGNPQQPDCTYAYGVDSIHVQCVVRPVWSVGHLYKTLNLIDLIL